MGRKKNGLEGFGTLADLSKKTGLNRYALYRLRSAGVFKVGKKLGYRRVYYDIAACVPKIKRFVHEREDA